MPTPINRLTDESLIRAYKAAVVIQRALHILDQELGEFTSLLGIMTELTDELNLRGLPLEQALKPKSQVVQEVLH